VECRTNGNNFQSKRIHQASKLRQNYTRNLDRAYYAKKKRIEMENEAQRANSVKSESLDATGGEACNADQSTQIYQCNAQLGVSASWAAPQAAAGAQ
jgi:hypothetical protein